MAKAKKYYAVKEGRMPGVYETWAECQSQTNGYSGAKFKSFDSRSAAEHAVIHGWDSTPSQKNLDADKQDFNAMYPNLTEPKYIHNSISVDAACSGNPGEMEYQCVDTDTGALIFTSKVYPMGTNNIGEFLAVVDALKHAQEHNLNVPIYTDSRTAIAWVRNKKVKTALYLKDETKELFRDIELAIKWLRENNYPNLILKWDTKSWGESKADFGRK